MEIQNITGGYVCSPILIRAFLSMEALTVFELINELDELNGKTGQVYIALSDISKMRRNLGYRGVKSALKELVDLGLIEDSGRISKKYGLTIMWDNVLLLSNIIQRISNYDGLDKLKVIYSGKHISDFKESVIKDICNQFPATDYFSGANKDNVSSCKINDQTVDYKQYESNDNKCIIEGKRELEIIIKLKV